MSNSWKEEYPEAAPYIQQAIDEHGEEWVIENYFPDIASLSTVMAIPDVEELPFFDPEKHDVLTDAEKEARADAYREYYNNLRTGTKPGEE